mgnify:CR=1 FL=1
MRSLLLAGLVLVLSGINVPELNAAGDPDARMQSDAPGIIDSKMIESNNQFALELYRMIRAEDANTFFAPYSISAAMAMTYAGAREESARQISDVLHFSKNLNTFNRFYSGLLKYIRSLNQADSLELSTANALFAQVDYPFSDAYFKTISDYYGAGMQNLDFRNETEKSRGVINQWVEEQTKNKIQELLIPGILTELTRLVLVNAVYFNGNWKNAFDPSQNRKMDFYVKAGEPVMTEYMSYEGDFRYLEEDSLQIVELPYAGGKASMWVMLPSTHSAITILESKLSKEQLTIWNNHLSGKKIQLRIPKFKTTSEFELSDALKKMGMPHPFSLDADLSGMTGKKDLMIDKVVHKAFIEVNEKGTEAAAATAVVIRTKNGVEITRFFANKPFIFLIRENTYGGILFMGRINNPLK